MSTANCSALPAVNPGVVGAPQPGRPHPPDGAGHRLIFARSGLRINWSAEYRSILEIAEACDIPARYLCRSGVCHTCVTAVVAGQADYLQPPPEAPPAATTLVCSAVPGNDLVLDP